MSSRNNRGTGGGRPPWLAASAAAAAEDGGGLPTGWAGVLAAGVAAALAGTVGLVLWRRWAAARRVVASSGPLRALQAAEAAGALEALWTPPATAASAASIFHVSTKNGFLPLVRPLRTLPRDFAELNEVVAALPQLLRDASPTALARAVAQVPAYRLLPALLTPLEKQCLFRDYSVLVSALLLEGKAKAGKPRARVPANIAVPFCTLAQDLSERAIMSYDSYCLANVFSMADDGGSGAAPPAQQAAMAGSTYGVLVDYEPGVSDAMHWEQLRLVRAFDGGAEECTFVTVHAEIEASTPALLRAYKRVLRGLGAGAVDAVLAGLQRLRDVQEKIVVSQLKMYNASDPRNYVAYVRPWIFGWSGNEDLPDGVVEFEQVFEGVSDAPTFLRGETGAQSTIVPSLDVFLGVTHRADALRAYLVDLEEYRPRPHREFLRSLRELMWSRDVGPGASSIESPRTTATAAAAVAPLDADMRAPHALRDFVRLAGDERLGAAFNVCVGLLWAFRDIHVTFALLYIGKNTARERATGGTPYRAYLKKHRDEALAHQLAEFGDGTLARWPMLDDAALDAELDYVLSPGAVSGIPPHLVKRHDDLIRRHGRDAASLKRKAFPAGASWLGHAEVAGSGGRGSSSSG